MVNHRFYNKGILAIIALLSPITAALLFTIFYKFRLTYLTDDKNKPYHFASYVKIVASVALIGFMEVPNLWLYSALLCYFTSDAYLNYERWKVRTALAKEESIEMKTPYVGTFMQPFISRLAFVGLLVLGAMVFSYYRTEQDQQNKTFEKQFAEAKKERRNTSHKVTNIAERAGDFISICTAYISYQLESNKLRDERLRKICKALKIENNGIEPSSTKVDSLLLLNESPNQ